jgi:hypothetical protein
VLKGFDQSDGRVREASASMVWVRLSCSLWTLSTETIRSHVKRVYRKLDVHSRQDALREALRLRGLAVHATDPHDRPHHPQIDRLAAPPA